MPLNTECAASLLGEPSPVCLHVAEAQSEVESLWVQELRRGGKTSTSFFGAFEQPLNVVNMPHYLPVLIIQRLPFSLEQIHS